MLKQDMSPSDKFLENHPNLLNYTHNILSKRKYTFYFLVFWKLTLLPNVH